MLHGRTHVTPSLRIGAVNLSIVVRPMTLYLFVAFCVLFGVLDVLHLAYLIGQKRCRKRSDP